MATYDTHELISIPRHPKLISQVSWPKYRFTDTGLIAIESKAEMKRRRLKSPDYLDALMMSFYTPPPDPKANRGRWINNI